MPTERSDTRQVGDTCEKAEVHRRKSVDDFICQYNDLEWTRFPQGHAANGDRPARRRCGRIAAGDRSTAQPRWFSTDWTRRTK